MLYSSNPTAELAVPNNCSGRWMPVSRPRCNCLHVGGPLCRAVNVLSCIIA